MTLTPFPMLAVFILGALVTLAGCANEQQQSPAAAPQDDSPVTGEDDKPTVIIKTNEGTIVAELWPKVAPATVDNFLRYVNEGHYDGTVFHRVIPGFMIQGGGFTRDLTRKPTHAPIRNEASQEAKNLRGTLAMARTSDIHSATAQFFINLTDNAFLDRSGSTSSTYGYCAFGKVVEGMGVVDRIAAVQTASHNGMENVPVETVLIESIRRAD